MNTNQHTAVIPEPLLLVRSELALSCAVDVEVDARHLRCPLPLLKAKQGLRDLPSGGLLRLKATDSGSLKDLVAFTQLTAHQLEAFAVEGDSYCYVIRKA